MVSDGACQAHAACSRQRQALIAAHSSLALLLRVQWLLAASVTIGHASTASPTPRSCPWDEGNDPFEGETRSWWPNLIASQAPPSALTAMPTEKGTEIFEVQLLAENCGGGITTQGWTLEEAGLATNGDWTARHTGSDTFRITVDESSCALTHLSIGAFVGTVDPSLRLEFKECEVPLVIDLPLNISGESSFHLIPWMCGVEDGSPDATRQPCKSGVEMANVASDLSDDKLLDVQQLVHTIQQVAFAVYRPAEDTPSCFQEFRWLQAMQPLLITPSSWEVLTKVRAAGKGDESSLGKPVVRLSMNTACVKGCDGTCPVVNPRRPKEDDLPAACFTCWKVMAISAALLLLMLLLGCCIGCICTKAEEKRKPEGGKVVFADGSTMELLTNTSDDPRGTRMFMSTMGTR